MQLFRTAISLALFLMMVACGNGSLTEPGPLATGQTIAGQTKTVETATMGPPPTSSPTMSPSATQTRAYTPTATRALSATATATATSKPSPTPLPPVPTDEPELVTVVDSQGKSVNVRSGPGTEFEVVGTLEPGETAAVMGHNGDESWWQVALGAGDESGATDRITGWVYAAIVGFSGDREDVATVAVPPSPTATKVVESIPAPSEADSAAADSDQNDDEVVAPDDLAERLRCGKDFCVTYQAMVPIWENGGCIGNHSIYVTVLEGPPPGRPMDGVVVGDTFGNIEVASGSKGPGQAEVTLWMNSMSLYAKRHIDGQEYTSEESFSFTSHDELIPAEVLAANGYCDGSVDTCREAQQHNQVCRGHYSYRVTFHKFD